MATVPDLIDAVRRVDAQIRRLQDFSLRQILHGAAIAAGAPASPAG